MALKWKLRAWETLVSAPMVSWIPMMNTRLSFYLTSEAEAGTWRTNVLEKGKDKKDRQTPLSLVDKQLHHLSSFMCTVVSLSSGLQFDVMVLFACH